MHGGDVTVMNCTYLVPRNGPYRLHDSQRHQMLDKRNPLSQLGSQWDGDKQGRKSAPHGAQPSIPSPPWNTSAIRKPAILHHEQTQMHGMPEKLLRPQSHTLETCPT